LRPYAVKDDWRRSARAGVSGREIVLLAEEKACYRCGHPFPYDRLYWLDHGQYFDRLLCLSCAQAEEDKWENAVACCAWCSGSCQRRDLTVLSQTSEHPYAANGSFCSHCLKHARIAYQRTCAVCGSVFRGSFRAKQTITTCPECRPIESAFERKVVRTHLTRAKQAGTLATLTLAEWAQTLQDFHGRCGYCQEHPYEVLEHFIPITHGGGTTADNCLPACNACNLSKHDYHPVAWLEDTRDDLLLGGRFGMIKRADLERVQSYLATRVNDE